MLTEAMNGGDSSRPCVLEEKAFTRKIIYKRDGKGFVRVERERERESRSDLLDRLIN